MANSEKELLVFISHASEDKAEVRELCEDLRGDGFDPWLDEERILPGQDWDLEIEKALRASEAILLCFSELSVEKEGYIQREYKRAMRYQEEKPEGTIFVIPVRLDECEMPFFIRELQWVDYPEQYERLVTALNLRRGSKAKPLKREKNRMKKKPTSKQDSSGGPTFNFGGNVEIKGDFVGGNQTKTIYGDQKVQIESPADFMAALQSVQAQIATLKAQANLNSAQIRTIQAVEQKVAEAAESASRPEPDANDVQDTLKDAKETMDLLSGGISSAVNLGTMLGNLAMMAIKIFGG